MSIRCAHDQDWLTCSTCLADCGASPCTTCVVQRRKAEAYRRSREAMWSLSCPLKSYAGPHRLGITGECTCGARPPRSPNDTGQFPAVSADEALAMIDGGGVAQ
jgi:hypothetical protein